MMCNNVQVDLAERSSQALQYPNKFFLVQVSSVIILIMQTLQHISTTVFINIPQAFSGICKHCNIHKSLTARPDNSTYACKVEPSSGGATTNR